MVRLRRALEDRITDPDLLQLFHDFVSVDLDLCAEEITIAYEQGLAARENT